MTPDQLRAYGEALFGPRWQTDLARTLAVSDRTIRYWLAGAKPLPDGVHDDIQRLIAERRMMLRQLSR